LCDFIGALVKKMATHSFSQKKTCHHDPICIIPIYYGNVADGLPFTLIDGLNLDYQDEEK